MELDQLSTNPSNQMDSPASPDPAPVQDKDYRNLTRLLINGKIPFHTHPLDEERKIKAVIKGIPLEIQTDEVKNDLVNQGYPICSVHRLHGRDGRPLSLVLAVLNKTESAKEMCKTSKVCGLSGITVEPPIKREDQDSATGAKTTGMQLLTAMLNPDVLSARSLIGLKSALAQGSLKENLHVCCVEGTTLQITRAPVPVRNAWFRNQPPRAAPEPTKGSTRPKPSGSAPVNDKSNTLGEDIKSVMAILRLVKSEGFAELASDFRRARTGEDRLAVILSHQDILSQLESL
ncbi:hypothetical protein EVAR_88456_1 [Eumeta japonica]|uniref:Pre-C2HC domain-containing protein n=1 Tax=Eumeta variegata TaxID=151549 RepID=A0A4C1XQY2_EUMVA|nr:hypothetical protein EVAR_88456_1 [Eumeta japonica]